MTAPTSDATRFAWSADRNPDWWLDAIADAMWRAHNRVRNGYPADAEWTRLATRTTALLDLGEVQARKT